MPDFKDNIYASYLRDLGMLVKEYSYEAKNKYLDAKGTEGEDNATGYLLGFHRIVTLMQQQAAAFGISSAEVNLDDIQEEFFWNDERREL